MGEESQNYVKVISHFCPIPEGQRGHPGIGDDDGGGTVPWHTTNTAGQGKLPLGSIRMTGEAKLSEVAPLPHTAL